MKNDKQELIEELTQLVEKPGGKQAIRFILNALGSVPLAGGVIAGTGSIWGEKEQQQFNEVITEWASKANTDIGKLMLLLSDQLHEPTKAHLSVLIGEITGLDLQESSSVKHVPLILNEGSVKELEPYISKGWISLRPNGNVMSMGANHRVGNSIEDKKRTWGTGIGFVLTIEPKYFQLDND